MLSIPFYVVSLYVVFDSELAEVSKSNIFYTVKSSKLPISAKKSAVLSIKISFVVSPRARHIMEVF